MGQKEVVSRGKLPPPSGPPRDPGGSDSPLDEVERALSVLQGRHPEHERSRRETMAAAHARGQALGEELSRRARRRLRRWLLSALFFAAFGAAATVAWQLVERTRAIRASFAAAEEATPFEARGWAVLATNELTAGLGLEADVSGARCYVALTTGEEPLRVTVGGRSFGGARSVGFCGCAKEHVSAAASSASGALVGLKLLGIDANVVGGPLGRAWETVAPAAWGPGGEACAEPALDAWIGARKWQKEAIDASWWTASPVGAALRGAGFQPVGGVAPGRPFGVIDAPAGACLLALAQGPAALWLRATGGVRLAQADAGALAWCSADAATTTVWRTGAARVVVLSAPATRVGGLLGTREIAAASGLVIPAGAAWLRDDDLSWEASLVARASTGASGRAAVTVAPLPLQPGAREPGVVALALSAAARVAADPAAAHPVCDPPLEGGAQPRAAICVSAEPLAFWRRTDAPAAAARSALPFWMAPLDPREQPESIAPMPALLGLARRLGAMGYTPTVLEGLTELVAGVRVVGRAGEDAVVAVGLAPKAPWAFPYTDGPAWSLDGAPRAIPLKPGDAVLLTARPLPDVPLEKRRTVVFRRAARDDG